MIIKTNNKKPELVIIDDEDAVRLALHTWYKYPSCHYVTACINNKTTSIHRFIMGAAEGQSIDHINGNRLDNRKVNLRICSHAANMKNRKPNKNGKSAYKGVIILPNGKYRAKIDSDSKRFELGVYPTERDAVIAYNAASKILHGEFAYMNELPELNTRAPSIPYPDMVERVARAIWNRKGDRLTKLEELADNHPRKAQVCADAKAALEAMGIKE